MARLAIIYGTGFGNTGLMAQAIEEGAKSTGVEVIIKNVKESGIADVEGADAIAIGSATYKGEAMPEVIEFVKGMAGLSLKGKVGIAFGSYGWSGEASKVITGMLKGYGMDVMEPPLRIKRRPADAGLEECRQLGIQIAGKLK
ncbi:MAG: flavodoxin domain-containing protein [Bacteroidales bacterium]|nr:flavodoxin domain-containing protein [ANME-2 cluster archaeon]MDT8402819.1 flavodoxin domain-containing protein [Bacteroidales bacterium]MDW7777042.1 flavodoxin domain-containing protein [Methanosarcinales archaeon]